MSPDRTEGTTHKEGESQPYALAARYQDERASGRSYEEAQEFIYTNTQLELSVYRLQLPQVDAPRRRLNATAFDWYVAVVGEQPPEEFDVRLRRILSTGEPASLPDEVLTHLLERRAQATQMGSWVEGHYWPGKRRRLR